MLKKYSFLDNINDHRIICAAELYAMHAHEPVVFLTSDALQYLLAQRMPLIEAQYVEESTIEIDFNGWREYHPNMDELTSLYADPTKNILNCKLNEFAKIYEGNALKDVLFWDGNSYRKLKYKDFVAPTGERIVPRNIEQKMYLDLLQNDDVPIKLCIGRFGTGKSMFAETWAAH